MAASLTRVQRNLLSEAILDGYRSPAAFQRMINLGTSERLADITKPGTHPDVVLEAIDYFESAGRVDELVAAAIQKRPRNPKLKAIAAELRIQADEAPGAYSLADPSTFDLTDLEDAFRSGERRPSHPAADRLRRSLWRKHVPVSIRGADLLDPRPGDTDARPDHIEPALPTPDQV